MQVSEISICYKSKIKPSERIKISTSKDAAEVFRSVFDSDKIEHKEMFYAAFTTRNNKILGVLLICEGGINGCMVDQRLIFQAAYKLNASGIIMCHNHPSGNMTASQEDINMTKKIKESCKILDFTLLDHIILSPEDSIYLSLADEGLI